MRLAKTLTIAIPLAALALAGCGGGGDDTTATTATATETTPTVSKADLIAQGDGICAEVNAAVGALGASQETPVPEKIIQTADLYVGMVERIQGLGTPDDTTGHAEFSSAAETLAKVEGEIKLAAEREDTTAISAASGEATAALEEFQSQAGIYGFEKCSEGPSAPASSGSAVAPVEEEAGGVEAAPEEVEEEVVPEEAAPEEVAPETGGAGGGVEEAAPESGGSAGGTSGGVGPG